MNEDVRPEDAYAAEIERFTKLGELISSFHALELSLRLVLCRADPSYSKVDLSPLYQPFDKGDWFQITPFRSRAGLRELIDDFNRTVQPISPSWVVKKAVVDTRDLVAHGRVWGLKGQDSFVIAWFGKASNGMVQATHHEIMDDHWILERRFQVEDELKKVDLAIAYFRDRSPNVADDAISP